MAPNSFLHGLNIVHSPEHIDSSQDLLSGQNQSYPELDLWTTLAFQTDESIADDTAKRDAQKAANRSQMLQASAHHLPKIDTSGATPPAGALPSFDLPSFLTNYGAHSNEHGWSQNTNLAQLLALHTQSQQHETAGADSVRVAQKSSPVPATTKPNATIASSPSSSSPSSSAPPPAKRSRVRSVSTANTSDSPASSPVAATPAALDSTGAAEDKRRRNTAASARFRMKKKEREAALEKHAKELEVRVNELEKECEGLRRENGWLKGLVVGVTGAGANGSPANTKKRQRDELDE